MSKMSKPSAFFEIIFPLRVVQKFMHLNLCSISFKSWTYTVYFISPLSKLPWSWIYEWVCDKQGLVGQLQLIKLILVTKQPAEK